MQAVIEDGAHGMTKDAVKFASKSVIYLYIFIIHIYIYILFSLSFLAFFLSFFSFILCVSVYDDPIISLFCRA